MSKDTIVGDVYLDNEKKFTVLKFLVTTIFQ